MGAKPGNGLRPADALKLNPIVSLTFDSRDSKILYAGTPHLAWKTSDGGTTWQLIHERMLDDSDVFSILVDNQRRQQDFRSHLRRDLPEPRRRRGLDETEPGKRRILPHVPHHTEPLTTKRSAGRHIAGVDQIRGWRQHLAEAIGSVDALDRIRPGAAESDIRRHG